MDEVLSYLLLIREDFTFRDDYVEKDNFRLMIVDTLMKQPLGMNNLVDECIQGFTVADTFVCIDTATRIVELDLVQIFGIDERSTHSYTSTSLAGVVKFLAELNGLSLLRDLSQRQMEPYVHFPSVRPAIWYILPDKWGESKDRLCEIAKNWAANSEQYLSEFFTEEDIDLIVENYRNLILEDVADKDKTAEEQDSISNVEEQSAIDFSKTATGLRHPKIPELSIAIAEIDNLKCLLEDNDRLIDRAAPRPVYKGKVGYDIGRVLIGSYGDDIHKGDYAIIIDPGGNDSYHLTYDPHNPHPTIIADFSGDDIYTAGTEFALACGAFAYSLLVDYEGDDIYRGGNFSLGAGYFGVGILWDKKGNDSYFGDTFTQGAGTFGLGLLIDSEGSDTYTGNLFCQGFGFVNGIGGIIDNSGNDTYTVQPKYGDYIRYEDHYISLSQGFGYGIRPWLSGGWGFLFDYGGNDVYVCDIFGQGASYWWSLGMLYDRSGNDQYLSHQYAQGSGTHMALGILRDDEGNDVYRAYGVSQGCGHDYSCGWLLDRSGDDLYASFDLSQGAGSANGFGVFTDLLGNDRYYVMRTNNTQGYGNPRRDYGSIGIFVDTDGDDRYDGNGADNRFWTTGSKWGGGLDRSIPRPDTTRASEAGDEGTK